MLPDPMAVRLRFAEFDLDLTAYALWRAGERVRLQRIPMELLIRLVQARGALVGRAELQTALWGADVFVDQEAAINTAVKKIRQALGDDPERPRFVETIVGKGYRFVATVVEVHEETTAVGRVPFPRYLVRHAGRDIALDEGDNLLGRDPDAHVYIDHPSVSRRHAIIRIQPNQAVIEDLGSRNGTFVDGRRIETGAELHDGSTIGAGPIMLTFRVMGAPGSTEPMNVPRRVTS